ncbi:MAG: hypothetical protein EP330_20995 [Deltaproteobacteria bacterium]|nr:MAG: hypothetical protein EP330_20995 [Deltaproteobacteria bacterium]
MTHRIALTAALALPLAFSLACGPAGGSAPAIPVLADLNPDAAGRVGLVDRDALLADAVDYDLADRGTALDASGAGFRMDFDGNALIDAAESAEVPPPSYSNVQAAWTATLAADLTTLAVVGPPRIAIGVAAAGRITQLQPNVWHATNTVDVAGRPVTADLTAAWVGVGWLAEMRVTDPLTGLDQAKWFSGFLGADGQVGWWDLYDGHGQLTGVVEWVADGQGNGEFGLVATAGEHQGDALTYTFVDETARIDHLDASTGEASWVFLDTDHSGEVRLPEHRAGEVGCWDADLLDVACP